MSRSTRGSAANGNATQTLGEGHVGGCFRSIRASAVDVWKEARWQGYAVQIICRTPDHDVREEGMCPRCHVFPAQSAAKTGHHGLPSANHSPLMIFGACGPSNPYDNSYAAEFFEISTMLCNCLAPLFIKLFL
jgi:hypothetical protein